MAVIQPSDTEGTPLLLSVDSHEQIYKRFSPSRKRSILAIISFTGLLALFVSGTFVPSIPQIAKDMNTTGSIVSLSISISILGSSLGSLIGASYSTFYGRKPVYLTCTPLLFVGSVGVARSRVVPELMCWRFIQAIGASPGLAVGSGVIGDIYKLEERGQAMGIFFGFVLLGPAIAPLVGGLAAHYLSWRLMQLILGVVGLCIFFIVVLFFPETSQPGQRGIDKLDFGSHPRWRPMLLNPFSPLMLMRSPNLMMVCLATSVQLLTDFVLLVPLAYTLGKSYGITNEALIGACFIPDGLGNMVGAIFAGRLSDKYVVKYRAARGGIWYPEDRLRATLFGAGVLVPMSVFLSGICTRYVPGKVGLVLNLLCLFTNGIGVDYVLSPSASYVVDLMHSKSADAMAANNGFRSLFMAGAVAMIVPMIETYGVVVTNTISAIVAWIGFGLLYYVIQHGDRLRAVVDVGFSTAANN